jgi:hypothetical protein
VLVAERVAAGALLGVGVAVRDGVAATITVGVRLGVGERVAVAVEVAVAVLVRVDVGVCVWVAVAVEEGVAVGVLVGVAVGVQLGVLDGVGLCVHVGEGVSASSVGGAEVAVASTLGVPCTSAVGVMAMEVKVGTRPSVGEGTAAVSAEGNGWAVPTAAILSGPPGGTV